MCPGLEGRNTIAGWDRLAKPPSARLKISLLSSLFRGSEAAFCSVTAGVNCLWCLRETELWQLVLSPGPTSRLRQRINWVKFNVHKDRAMSRISAGGEHVFAVSSDGSNLVRLDLSSAKVQWEELPFHGCGDITLSSLSVCCLPGGEQRSLPTPTTSPNLYPKLPKLTVTKQRDICCENGTCSFCRRQQRESYLRTESHHYRHKSRENQTRKEGHLVGQKRHLDDDTFYTCYTYQPLKRQRRGNWL